MIRQIKLRQNCVLLKQHFRLLSAKALPQSEYTEKPEYPPIEDLSYRAIKEKNKQTWYDEIQKLNTVEEKQIKINMPRYYGFKSTMLSDQRTPYNCLPMIQHRTETVFEEVDALPALYNTNDKEIDSFIELLKGQIEDAIRFEYTEFSRSSKANINVVASLIEQINRLLLNNLAADYEHLNECETDVSPRHEAFWFVDGIMPPERVKAMRERNWEKDMADNPILRPYQYIGKPYLALRHKNPLQPIETVGKTRAEVPRYKFDSRTLGYSTDYRHGITIPGFWPGCSYEHAVLSYQNRKSLLINAQTELQKTDQQNMIHAQGIQSSYAWLHGIANYQGFTTFNDITYPLTTQTIVTDGRQWSFYAYQLNTTRIGNENLPGAPNLCWGTKEVSLFEEIKEDGSLVGFNSDVLKNLIKFYINAPKERANTEMKPYLGKTEQVVADIDHEERRIFLENVFKQIASNRPRHRTIYEIYNWEKIYKIDNNTKPMDAKRRPFELRERPYKRRLDEHTPRYIPKVLRPGGPKSKDKWEKTYYP